jgi:hypothetical protein
MATNPKTGEQVLAVRRRLKRDFDLPLKDDDSKLILSFLTER